jgi:hypothetical protein
MLWVLTLLALLVLYWYKSTYPDAEGGAGELVTISLLDVRNNVLQSLPDSVILLYNCQVCVCVCVI